MGKERSLKNGSLLTRIVVIAAAGWTTIFLILFSWAVQTQKGEIFKLANQQAKAFFQEILTTRSWNATHEGNDKN